MSNFTDDESGFNGETLDHLGWAQRRWFQIVARPMVLGDIIDWADSRSDTWDTHRRRSTVYGWSEAAAWKKRAIEAEGQVDELEKQRNEYADGYARQRLKVEELEIEVAKWKEQASVMRGCGLVQTREVERLQAKIKRTWDEGWEAGWKASEELI